MRPDALCGVLALPKHVFNAGFLAPHVLNMFFMVLVTAEAKQAPERLWKKHGEHFDSVVQEGSDLASMDLFEFF